MKKDLHAKGMTLVELLIAMVLSGLLMVLLTHVLQNIQHGWKKTEQAALVSDDLLAGVQYLFSALSGALAPDPNDQTTQFFGVRDRIEFMGAPAEAESSQGPRRMRLYVARQAEGSKALIAETVTRRPDDTARANGSKKVLTVLHDVESVAFSFSGMRNGQMHEEQSWSDPGRLPTLVRVDLVFANKNMEMLQLMIAPRRNVSGRCVFDLVSLSCRT